MQEIDFKKFAKFSKPGPRYTSYPTAIEFSEAYTYDSYINDLQNDTSPLSLYIHLPFVEVLATFVVAMSFIPAKKKIKLYI